MDWLFQTAAAFVGSLGFSMVFHVNKKYWLLISVDAALSWLIFLGCDALAGNFFANLVSAAFCSLYAHLSSRAVKAPVTCLLMPATVPMIPGSSLYYTMFYALRADTVQFRAYALATGQSIFGMAIGFALVSVAFLTYENAQASKEKL